MLVPWQRGALPPAPPDFGAERPWGRFFPFSNIGCKFFSSSGSVPLWISFITKVFGKAFHGGQQAIDLQSVYTPFPSTIVNSHHGGLVGTRALGPSGLSTGWEQKPSCSGLSGLSGCRQAKLPQSTSPPPSLQDRALWCPLDTVACRCRQEWVRRLR